VSKPRWRWATRDGFPLSVRTLWPRKPSREWGVWVPTWEISPRGGAYANSRARMRELGLCREVSRTYFRKRFGRDMRPGEIRRLP